MFEFIQLPKGLATTSVLTTSCVPSAAF